jgi:hypothetical protein
VQELQTKKKGGVKMTEEKDKLEIPEGSEIVVQPQGQTIEQQTSDRIKEMEASFKIAGRMVQLALSRTRPGDWVDIGGKPYLQASGAKKLLLPFGISVDKPKFTMETKEAGKHGQPEIIYHCEVTIYSKKMSAYNEIGSASSADEFFCLVHDKGPDGKWAKDANGEYIVHYLPPAEIDMSEVQKKSYANAIGRAVKAMLGLENLTWDDLGACGITRAEKGYAFNKDGQGGGATTDEGAARKRQEIRDMLLEALGGDTGIAQEALKQLTMFNGRGVGSVDQITDKAVNINHQKVKAFCEAFRANPDMAGAVKAGRDAVEKK